MELNGTKIIQCHATKSIPATQWMAVWNQARFVFVEHFLKFHNSKKYFCFFIYLKYKHKKVHAYLYSFVPFGVLIIVNVLLIRAMRQKIRDLAGSSFIAKKKQLSISVSVMLLTLFFILFTLPMAIVTLLVNSLTTTHDGKLVLFCFGCFSFTYHAFNLVVLCRFNKYFFMLCKEVLKCGDSVKSGKINKEFNVISILKI